MESSPPKKRFLPSTAAAVVVGAVWMPVFLLVNRLLEATAQGSWLEFIWWIAGFVFPVALSTGDFKYVREHGGYFSPMWSKEDFQLFYIPAWKRMLVLFASMVISFPLIGGVAWFFGISVYR